MEYQVIVMVEAQNAEDACYRVLGWEPRFVKEATVIVDGKPQPHRLGRRGYEGWEPSWSEVKGNEDDY